jgi:hypothetical protein
MNKVMQAFVRKKVKELDSDIAEEILGDLFIAAIDREMDKDNSILAMDMVLTRIFNVKDFT